MQSVKFMNPVSFLTKTIHRIFEKIDRKKSEIIKWIWIEMQSNARGIALAIVSIYIKSYVWKLADLFNQYAACYNTYMQSDKWHSATCIFFFVLLLCIQIAY